MIMFFLNLEKIVFVVKFFKFNLVMNFFLLNVIINECFEFEVNLSILNF